MASFGVLGPLRVQVDGRDATLGGPRRNEVLAVLLANRGSAVSVERLTEALWGEHPPPTATRSLRAHVSALRAVLGKDAIATAPGGYRMPSTAPMDVDGFVRDLSEARANARAGDIDAATHRYTRALSWWRGQPYEDIHLEASDIADERRRLGVMRVQAWRERAKLAVSAGHAAGVLDGLRELVEQEPWDEPLVQQLATVLYRLGRQAEALQVLADLRGRLRDELGLDPSVETRDLERAILRQDLPSETDSRGAAAGGSGAVAEGADSAPLTRYARSGPVNIAYQVFGSGPVDLLFVWGTPSNVDLIWDEPRNAGFLRGLGQIARVISFDKRGLGVSDPTDSDTPPDMGTRLDDAVAVLDAVGSQRAVVLGLSEGGPAAIALATRHPDRVSSLVLCGAYSRIVWADDHPFGLTPEQSEPFVSPLREGRTLPMELYFPNMADDPASVRWFHRFFQNSASPKMMAEALRTSAEVDVRNLLPKVAAPTLILHSTGDVAVPVEHGRHLAEAIPDATLREIPGISHWPWLNESAIPTVLAAIAEHLTGG